MTGSNWQPPHWDKMTEAEKDNDFMKMTQIKRLRPETCECDNTHEQNNTCCQPCWDSGFRTVNNPTQTKQAKHTALPWTIGAGDEQDGYGILGNTKPSKSLIRSTVSDHVAIVKGEANAELIIKCVNSHEELLVALQQFHVGMTHIELEAACANAQSVITKAGGEA